MTATSLLMSDPTPTAPPRDDRRLTIGMPLYNNAPTIRRALDSLLAQTFRDFSILISDDGSTDGTPSICEEYARRDARITVVRQPRNLNYGNFRFVLRDADTPFFMFAAGDDYWHPDYARRMIDVLDRQGDVVCAVSRVMFMKDGQQIAAATGTRALESDRAENIARFLEAGDDNSRMYGVFRTDVARRAFPTRDFFGYDWAFSVGTLQFGKHVEVPDVMMWRDHTDPSRYIEYVRRDARGPLNRVLPMLQLTKDVLLRLRIPITADTVKQLLNLNLIFHFAYLRRYHPAAAAAGDRIRGGAARVVRTVLHRNR